MNPIKWFQDTLAYIKTKHTIDNAVAPIAIEPLQTVTNSHEMELRKKVNISIDAQEQSMQARSMKAHEMNCDIISCKKRICFKRVPDKIVEIKQVTSEEIDKERKIIRARNKKSLEIKKKLGVKDLND